MTDTNNTDGAALLPVTKAARDAACEYLSDIAGLRGKDAVTEIHDDHPTLIAFARFERDTIERHRQSSNAAGVGVDEALSAALDELDRESRCAHARGEDGKRVALAVLRKHFGGALVLQESEFAPLTNTALRARLASLSTPTAEPMGDALTSSALSGDAGEGVDREWCINMAKKEAGYDIGAGVVAIDPNFPEQEGGE